MMAGTAPLQKALYEEMLSHIQQTDVQPPYLQHGWYYYSRTEAGKQYPIFARKKTLQKSRHLGNSPLRSWRVAKRV